MENHDEKRVRIRTGDDFAGVILKRGYSFKMLAMKTGFSEAKLIAAARSGSKSVPLNMRRACCQAMGVWDDERE